MRNKIAFAALIVILGLVNWSILKKERHLAEGKIVYLDFRPVDPRSLMQGDYMALNYGIANAAGNAIRKEQGTPKLAASDGYLILQLDERSIGTFKDLYKDQALEKNEIMVRYRVRNNAVKFATNAFFFQENHGKIYQNARYGQFRVDEEGEMLLTAMMDEDLNKLEADKKNRD